MRRIAPLVVSAALLLGGCQNSDNREGDLRARLEDARARTGMLQQKLAATQAKTERDEAIDKQRYADLWKGGPVFPGPLVSLPLLGTLEWRCGDDRRASFTFRPAGATVRVAFETSDGARRARNANPGDRVTAPPVNQDENARWIISYRHKPGFVSADITVAPRLSRKRKSCLASITRLKLSGHPWE